MFEGLVDKIRIQYPNPISATDNDYGTKAVTYCVGGAFLLYNKMDIHGTSFPGSFTLAEAIARFKHEGTDNWLSYKEEAEMIVDYNDEGEFEKAWTVLNEALIRE